MIKIFKNQIDKDRLAEILEEAKQAQHLEYLNRKKSRKQKVTITN